MTSQKSPTQPRKKKIRIDIELKPDTDPEDINVANWIKVEEINWNKVKSLKIKTNYKPRYR